MYRVAQRGEVFKYLYHMIRLNTLVPILLLILYESENEILYRRRNKNSTGKKDKVFKIEIEIWVAKNCQKNLQKQPSVWNLYLSDLYIKKSFKRGVRSTNPILTMTCGNMPLITIKSATTQRIVTLP